MYHIEIDYFKNVFIYPYAHIMITCYSNASYLESSISFQCTIIFLDIIKKPTTRTLTKGEEYFDLSKYVMTAAHDHKSLYLVTSLTSINYINPNTN